MGKIPFIYFEKLTQSHLVFRISLVILQKYFRENELFQKNKQQTS